MSTVAVGVDVVDVDRFTLALTRRPQMTERVFTVAEREDCVGRPERLAARFAAKEAVMKALGVGLGEATFRDIEVRREPSGAPRIDLHGDARILAASRGIAYLHVSLSHTATTATAFIVASDQVPDAR